MNRQKYKIITILAWLIPFIVIAVMVGTRPLKRTVTPLYHEASANWWARQDLYNGPAGMNYLPHFAILFSPFQALPTPVGDILWRAMTMGLLAYGSWRIISHHLPENRTAPSFMWFSVLILPVCLAALRNGQANATFGGLILCGMASLSDRKWWQAAVWMAIATMVKPLGIVMLLLAPAIYPMMILPVLCAFAGCVVFPFAFAAPDYVISQLQAFLKNLNSCSEVTQNRFADINGIIRALGGELPAMMSKLMRVVAGALFLGLTYFGGRRMQGPGRFLWLFALATGYLMLFNPMTEYNSYVILAPAMGLWMVWFLSDEKTRGLGWTVGVIILSMGLLPSLMRPWFGNHFGLVWPPLMTIGFLVLLFIYVFRPVSECQAPDERKLS